MFQILHPAPPTLSRRALAISVLAHAAGIALLLSARFVAASTPPGALRVTLIAPLSGPLPAPFSAAGAVTKPVPRSPRVFRQRPVPAPVAPNKMAFDVPPALAIEAPPIASPATELPHLDRPRVPLPTDNFSPASAVAVPLAVPVALKPARSAGFSSVEASAPPPHSRPTTTGAFKAAVSAQHEGLGPRAARAAGFSESAGQVSPPAARRAVSNGGFGDTVVSVPMAAREPTAAIPYAGVEILFKPRPVYTGEARRLQIEGEVLLEMLFQASGEARVLRVVRGLGHGLDESATAAARGIRFRSAVDSTAIVHIVFQLAY